MSGIIKKHLMKIGKYSFILLITFFLQNKELYAQHLKLYNLNASGFPDITANFALYDEKGDFVYDIIKDEVFLSEDSVQRQVLEFYNPAHHIMHSSIVLMLDISRSMTGERLQIVKDAAVSFINMLPLDVTEVAIGTFNDDVYLNCDFTQKSDRLQRSIRMIMATGQTDYNDAFLFPHSGAIDIASHGFYKKKIVIFLTDGLADALTDQIIRRARGENISVYCITVKLKMPYTLKQIAGETGGEWYEEVNTYDISKEIYSRIFEHAQASTFGYIHWRSDYTCQSSVNMKLSIRGITSQYQYTIPYEKRGKIEAGSPALYFTDVVPGVKKVLTATFNAINIPITITGISSANSNYFGYEKKGVPLLIQANSTLPVYFYYTPPDSGIKISQFTISTRECGNLLIRAYGGCENKVKLSQPTGGEVFTPGMETSIIWDGVEKNTNVLLSVKNKLNNNTWIPILTGSGLKSPWVIPADTGMKIMIKASTLQEIDKRSDLLVRTRIRNGEVPLFSANYNSDGTEIYTCDSTGLIKVWKAGNGQLIKKLDRPAMGYIIYNPSYDRIISLSESGISIYTNRTGMYIGYVGSSSMRLLTPVISYNGKEYYSTATQEIYTVTPVSWKTGKNAGIWDPLQKSYLNLPDNKKYKEAAISRGNLYALTSSKDKLILWNMLQGKRIRKFEPGPDFRTAIFNPEKNVISINNQNSVVIYDIDKRKNLLKINDEKYDRYSPNGRYLVTKQDSVFKIRSIAEYEPIKAIINARFIKFSTDGENILYACNDSVFLYNLKNHKVLFRKYFKNMTDAILSQDENKILIYNSNSVEIIDLAGKKDLFYATFRKNEFRTFVFNPLNENILSITDDNEAVVWKPSLKTSEDSSGYFTILSPEPVVTDTVFFGEHYINTPVEFMVIHFLENHFMFPVKIENIQITGDDDNEFSLVSELPPYPIDPGSSKDIELRFCPQKRGQRKAALILNTPTNVYKTVLTGTGIVKSYNIPSELIDFGPVDLFTEKDTLILALRNLSTDSLIISEIENAGPDSEQFIIISRIQNKVVPPGGYLNLALRFAPVYRGRTSSQLKLILQNTGENVFINLFGEGKSQSVIYVSGLTLNVKDSLPLESGIRCINLSTARCIIDTCTDTAGKFGFLIRPGNKYALIGEKKGYISSSENLDLDRPFNSDTIYRNIFLSEIEDRAIVKLNNIFFEFGKADLLNTSMSDLNRLYLLMNERPDINLEIHGHTDSIGSSDSNDVLASKRAISVKDYLVSKGINKNRIFIKSFGESKPVATNETEEGRQLNRRVEIRILKEHD